MTTTSAAESAAQSDLVAGPLSPVAGASARATRPTPRVVAVAAFVAVATILACRVVANLNVPGAPALPRMGMQDFRDVVYWPARAFLDGRNPYDTPALLRDYPAGAPLPPYLPMTLVLHAPLGLLPFEAAEATYFAILLAAILGVAYVALRAAGVAPTAARVFGVGAAVLASRPGHWSVVLGQCSPIAVLGCAVALWMGRARPLVAAFGLALAAFKPTFGVPLAVLMLARGDRRAAVTGAVLAGAVSAVATAAVAAAAGGLGALATSIGQGYVAFSGDQTVDPAVSWSRIDAIAVTSRLLGWSPGPGVALAIGGAVLALGALGVARLARSATPGARRLSTGLACLTIVACTYHQGYDLVLLTLPATALAFGADDPPWRGRPWARRALLALLAIPAINYLSSEYALERLGFGHGVWIAVTVANGLAVLAAFAILARLALGRADRSTRFQGGTWQ
jgi:glycosyl transferase family 87